MVVSLVTAAVAVYGAGLATYNLIHARKGLRPNVRVGLSMGFLTYGPELSESMLIMEAANHGAKMVTLGSPGLLVAGRQVVFPSGVPGDVPFPYELPEGKSCRAWTEARDFALHMKRNGFGGRVRIVAFYRDAVGTMYRSKPLKFEVDQWCRAAS